MSGCPHIDLTAPETYEGGMPREVFSYLRNQAPIYWHEDPAQGVAEHGLFSHLAVPLGQRPGACLRPKVDPPWSVHLNRYVCERFPTLRSRSPAPVLDRHEIAMILPPKQTRLL